MHLLIIVLVSLLASVIGAIAGIGGGVIIRPVLDSLGIMEVAAISFLSGCTVLSMSAYNAARSIASGDKSLKKEIAFPLGIGAAAGGVLGKYLFSYVSSLFENASRVGAVQSACLFVVTLITFVYTLKPSILPSLRIKNPLLSIAAGLLLGLISAFLGIGGGPINLVVLFYLFSMDTKTAAQNSLYIILFSQFTSLVTTLVTGKIPEFEWIALLFMIIGGLAGGVMGRMLNSKLNSKKLDKIFLCAMAVIILISCYNAVKFAV